MPRRTDATTETASLTEDRKSARQRVLDAAMEMFYYEGVRAVGVDSVVTKAGVCKMSLYRAFPSKDDLVVAFLEEASRRYWQWWDKVVGRAGNDPRAQLREIFQALAHRTSGANYRGCPFVNTAVEFPDPTHPGRAIALAHRRELRRRLRQLCERVGAADPAALADQLLLLMEGAYSVGTVMPGESPSPAVVQAAEVLVTIQVAPPNGD